MNNLGSTAFVLTFLLGGVILISFFVMLLLSKAKNLKKSRWFLIAILFFLILHLNTFLFFTTEKIKEFPHLLGVSYPSLFLLGPTYLFFIKSFNQKSIKFKKSSLLHFIPFVIILWQQIGFFIKDRAYKLEAVNYYYEFLPIKHLDFVELISASAFVILFFVYLMISLREIELKANGNKTILKRITWVLIILCLCYFLVQTGFLIIGVSAIIAEMILASLLAFSLLYLGYFILDVKEIVFKNKNKYETSPLNFSEQDLIKEKLLKSVLVDEVYRTQNLKIKDLSLMIDVPSHHISQVLSEKIEQSFYDFINFYRVEAVKKMLKNGTVEKISIQAIGEECGFNNKTSFYRAFKKFTNTTPNQFLNNS